MSVARGSVEGLRGSNNSPNPALFSTEKNQPLPTPESSKQLGVTPPISLKESSAEEQEVTARLVEALREAGQFESEEESRQREVVLGKLNKLVQKFVYHTSIKKKYPESVARECSGKIFTFGSYRLGVHGKDADIDTLCVVPSHVTREDFFDIMLGFLKDHPEVEELTSVPEAYVPVINMVFSGVQIDLTFASLQLPKIPEDLELLDTNLLRNLDEKSIRSVNGSRVTDEILRLVPNVQTFRLALRCIKQWAKKRAIYSNAMGFLGGVAWAMLVARVCQLYPNASAGGIVARFFRIMYRWKWPQPVLLKPIEDGPLHARVWNPKIYPQDQAHRMPIITPAYPSMCATHNVYQSALQIMTSEFKRGQGITEDIIAKKTEWPNLFEKLDFFYKYKYYMQVTAASTDSDTQHKINGLVKSTLRHFVMKLESVDMIKLVHPYIRSIERVVECADEASTDRIRKGEFLPEEASDELDKAQQVSQQGLQDKDGSSDDNDKDKSSIFASQFYIGMEIDTKSSSSDKSNNVQKRLDLSWATKEYAAQVKKAEWWTDESMSLTINFKRGHELPAYVLEPGRPRLKKRKGAKSDEDDKKRKRSKSTTTIPSPSTSSKGGLEAEDAVNQELTTKAAATDTITTAGDANEKQQQPQAGIKPRILAQEGNNASTDTAQLEGSQTQQKEETSATMPMATGGRLPINASVARLPVNDNRGSKLAQSGSDLMVVAWRDP